MMKKFNEVTLNITVAIIDFLYQGRDYQRFWVLEEIARAPYFAFLSVLHLRERIHQLRMGHLFEEPCPLYEPDEDNEHF